MSQNYKEIDTFCECVSSKGANLVFEIKQEEIAEAMFFNQVDLNKNKAPFAVVVLGLCRECCKWKKPEKSVSLAYPD